MKKFVCLSVALLLVNSKLSSDIDLGESSGEINEELMPQKVAE
jgi:hypothetical protein